MSKVIKDSHKFIPETLVSRSGDSTSSWGNIAKQVDVYERSSISDNRENYDPEPDANEIESTLDDAFESDFSAPVQTVEDDAHQSQQTEEQLLPEEEKIDIKALAEENFNRGVQTGIERMESDYGSSIRTLQSICEQLNHVRDTILRNSQEELVNLVLKLSEKIIRHSVASQHDTIIETVKESIQQAVKSDEFIISVHPDDYEVIQSRSPDFINSISGLENIVVKIDSSVDQGGCMIESSNCTVDASLASQLDIVAEAIKKK